MLIIITLGRPPTPGLTMLIISNCHVLSRRKIMAQHPTCLKIKNYNSLNIILTCAFTFPFKQTHVN